MLAARAQLMLPARGPLLAALLAVRAGVTRIEGCHLQEASRRVQLAKAAGPQQLLRDRPPSVVKRKKLLRDS